MDLLHRRFRYSFNYATVALVFINALVFVFTGCGQNSKILFRFGLQPIYFVKGHCYWQVFTYMFMHGSWSHLISNMFGLLVFGLAIEKRLGSKEFVLCYLLCGVLSGIASVAVYIFGGMWYSVLVGASGAVYAILLVFSVIFPTSRVFIFWLIPIPAPLCVIIYAGISIFEEVFGINSGVAHLTHLFGFAAAWIYCLVRFGVNPLKVWKNALR